MCRYVYHTLRNSKHLVDNIDEADLVYVYDYCCLDVACRTYHRSYVGACMCAGMCTIR